MSTVVENTKVEKSNENITSVDLVNLRSLAQKNMAKERYDDFKLIINSLIDRQDFAKYHYREYRRIIDSKDNIHKQMNLIMSNKNDDYWDQVGIRTHVLSCMQNLHIVHDILAHLIAYALDLKFSNERNITLKNVHDKIQKNIDYSSIDSLLLGLIENDNFKYLVANVNHSKHKYNIDPSITLSPQEESPFTCSFSQFTFHGKEYIKKDTDKFINSEFNRELKLVLHIENELINILSNKI